MMPRSARATGVRCDCSCCQAVQLREYRHAAMILMTGPIAAIVTTSVLYFFGKAYL